MQMAEFRGRGVVEGYCVAEALVSSMPISFLGDVDPETGRIIARGHDLYGKVLRGKVLCFPHGHGSTVGSYILYSLAKNGAAPKAIVNEKADPVIVVGAVMAEIPMVEGIAVSHIKSGDIVEVDANAGVVRILRGRR